MVFKLCLVSFFFSADGTADVLTTLRIFGEPPPLNTLFLFEKFTDSPQGRGTEYAYDSRNEGVLDEQGTHDGGQAYDQIDHPRTCAPIVFRLDDNGVPDADSEKGADRYDDASKIHNNNDVCPF